MHYYSDIKRQFAGRHRPVQHSFDKLFFSALRIFRFKYPQFQGRLVANNIFDAVYGEGFIVFNRNYAHGTADYIHHNL